MDSFGGGAERGGVMGEVVDVRSGEVEKIVGMEGGSDEPRSSEQVAEIADETVKKEVLPGPSEAKTEEQKAGTDDGENLGDGFGNVVSKDGEGIEKSVINEADKIIDGVAEDPRKSADMYHALRKTVIKGRFGREIEGGK